MSYIASVVLTEAAEVYLNDSSRAHYTNSVLLPYLKAAYKDLQLELFLNGMVILEEVSASLTLPALSTSMSTAGILPADFIQPVTVFERPSTDHQWSDPLDQRDWEDNADAADYVYLGHYAWREQDIKFRGCNVETLILLRYRKELSAITSENSTIILSNSQPYLSARTAFYASGFGGGNALRAEAISRIAEVALKKLTQSQVRETQLPVRRKPYGYGRRMRNRYS